MLRCVVHRFLEDQVQVLALHHAQLHLPQRIVRLKTQREAFRLRGTAYAGSVVQRGEATAEVTATGARTQFGKTAELVRIGSIDQLIANGLPPEVRVLSASGETSNHGHLHHEIRNLHARQRWL